MGPFRQWVLTMIPLDEQIQQSVNFIRLGGHRGQIHEIEIHESNGDHAILRPQPKLT